MGQAKRARNGKMKKIAKLALGVMLGAAGMTGSAHAAADIEDSETLISACQSLLDNGAGEGSKGAACKEFVTGLVLAQEETLTMGEPFRARRIGPKEDQNACFELPDKLSYRDFAQQVVGYAGDNPDMRQRPAFELAVRALERKYPCNPEDLKDMEDADTPAE
jgi:hypothetical protein